MRCGDRQCGGGGGGGGWGGGWWRTGDNSPHTRPSLVMSSASTSRRVYDGTYPWWHILRWLHSDTFVHKQAYKQCTWGVKTLDHLQTLARHRRTFCQKGLFTWENITSYFIKLFMCKVDPSAPKGDLIFFSPPTHSDSHTRIIHWYKTWWQLSLIPAASLAAVHPVSELLWEWKWGYFRDSGILFSKHWTLNSTVLGSHSAAEFLSLFRSG